MVRYLFRHIRRDDGGYGDPETWPFAAFFVFPLELEVAVAVVPPFVWGIEIDSASLLLASIFFAFFLVIVSTKLLVGVSYEERDIIIIMFGSGCGHSALHMLSGGSR